MTRILFLIVNAITGLLLGLGLASIEESTSAGRWTKLPAPPEEVVELIPNDDPPLFIKTIDGKTYRYDDLQDRRWIETSVPPKPLFPLKIHKPCDTSYPEFKWPSDTPRDIVDCIQVEVMYADGVIRYTFVVDKSNTLWQSHITHTANASLFKLICWPSIGLLLGLSGGIFLVNTKMNRAMSKTETYDKT